MEKTQIFINKLTNIIINGNNDDQLLFLKIYPIFKEKINIFEKWNEIYVNAKKSDIDRSKIINFIALALSNNFIEYKASDIFELIKIMHETNEDEKYIDIVKINVISGRSNNGIKKNQLINMIYKKNKENITYDIKNFSPHEIAVELTIRTTSLIKNMSFHEMIYISQHDNLKFNENDPHHCLKIIDDFHRLSFMMPTMILLRDNNNVTRIKTIKYLLKLCTELKQLHNYNSLFAIVAGLNNLAVQKISQLWKPNTSHYELFNTLCDFISPLENFGKYRVALKKYVKNNCVPYIGTIIFDMKHTLENDLYDVDNQDFNWNVCHKIIDIISELKNIELDDKIKSSDQICDWFSSFVICDDDDRLYDVAMAIIDEKKKSDLSHSSEPGSPVKLKNKLRPGNIRHKHSSSEGSDTENKLRPTNIHRKLSSSEGSESENIPHAKFIERSILLREEKIKIPVLDISSIPENISDGSSPRTVYTDSPRIVLNGIPIADNDGISIGKSRIPIIVDDASTCKQGLSINEPVKINVMSNSDPFLLYITDNYKMDDKNSVKLKKKIFRRKSISPSDSPRLGEFEKDIANSRQVTAWNDKHVKIWLKLIGMDAYCESFIRQKINGQVLLDLTEDHLKNDLDVSILGHRLLILKSIDTLRVKNTYSS